MTLKKINSLKTLLKDASNECLDSADIWWIYAVTPDKFLFDYWDPKDGLPEKLEEMKRRLLELRIFSEKAEYKAFRGDIGHELCCRKIIDDEDLSEDKYFDEIQYLDINLRRQEISEAQNRSGGKDPDKKEYLYARLIKPSPNLWEVRTTTGGGPYTVPLENLEDACVKVRNYLKYSKVNGQAYIYDFRLVKLDNEKLQDH